MGLLGADHKGNTPGSLMQPAILFHLVLLTQDIVMTCVGEVLAWYLFCLYCRQFQKGLMDARLRASVVPVGLHLIRVGSLLSFLHPQALGLHGTFHWPNSKARTCQEALGTQPHHPSCSCLSFPTSKIRGAPWKALHISSCSNTPVL